MDLKGNIQEPNSVHVQKRQLYSVSLPKDTKQCRGCPYPSVGFICWATDGSCMRTEINKINGARR
ncbi:hypothetical protein Cpap_0140 [Ruminiclostridium papyrosolvens DSM 2782]|uniref:Uncharacterized protein n=1 Tax=Ruminiclostridium papyrosolvens DSM 2782 TaxID=588581 RepID=F1TIF6_9FIRM|nr:hypothetical protein [Ruminiclostridium papyrosolvens]EGD45773.1 hypothetical protein Cpap_0140 [Ruminiclostridium papyrosolvens DSM 2782]WES33906.1 hypothetical protein P0092_19400 [Ruminiclostridium papyrosolvens DSM 2782]